jgi:riboflavin-specific deaminase-like protein
MVTLAYAQSLDGCLTIERGRPTALSGPEALRLTHALRAAHQGIVAGVGTIAADNPQLTVRLVEGRNPRPVILDTHLRIPEGSVLLARDFDRPLILCGEAAADSQRAGLLRKAGLRVLPCPLDEHNELDLAAAFRLTWQEGIDTLMVEGGARVITSLLRAGLYDQAIITISPVWLGGLASVEGGVGTNGAFPALADLVYEPCGQDLVVWGKAAKVSL